MRAREWLPTIFHTLVEGMGRRRRRKKTEEKLPELFLGCLHGCYGPGSIQCTYSALCRDKALVSLRASYIVHSHTSLAATHTTTTTTTWLLDIVACSSSVSLDKKFQSEQRKGWSLVTVSGECPERINVSRISSSRRDPT